MTTRCRKETLGALMVMVAVASVTAQEVRPEAPPASGVPESLELASEPFIIGQRVSLRSYILGEGRQILVRVPVAYESSRQRYPVIYLLDGPQHFQHVSAAARILALDYQIPEVIVVGVAHLNRSRELSPSAAQDEFSLPLPFSPDTLQMRLPTADSRADDFLRFLDEELVPFIEGRYRTAPFRVLIGHSLGGLFVSHVLLTRPQSFNAYIASSPSLSHYRSAIEAEAPVRLTTQSFEGRFYLSTVGEEEPWNVASARILALAFERFRPNGLRWWHRVLPGESHRTVVYPTVYEGLRMIFSDYRVLEWAIDGDVAALEAHVGRASRIYGYEIGVPEGVIDDWGRDRLELAGNVRGALQLFRRNVELHPNSPNVYASLADALEVAGQLEEALQNREEAVRRAEEAADPRAVQFRRSRDVLREKIGGR